MAIKMFNRTVEAINTLLDKLDAMPAKPMNYKGELVDVTALPDEPSEGDTYLITFETGTTNIANKLYYKKASSWEIIATLSYTKAEIDAKTASKYTIDDGSSSAGTATVTLSGIADGLYTVLVSSDISDTEYGVSMYSLKKSTGSIELFTAVKEVANATISSITVSDGVATITYDATGKHIVRFIGG